MNKKLTMTDATLTAPTNKVYFQTTDKEPILPKPKVDFNLSAVDIEIQKRKDYNANINVVADVYREFKPYQQILIRAFVREIKEGKLYTGESSGFDKINIPSANVQGATWRTVDNPYPFAGKCIVVAVPQHITNIKVGDILAIPQLPAQAGRKGDDSVIYYEYFFIHPDSNQNLPEKNMESEHFGYALIPQSIIYGFLNETK